MAEHGSRGSARLELENARAARKAEAFERALSQVSRRVAILARESAVALRAERLALARGLKQRDWPAAGEMVTRQHRPGPADPPDRALRTPASERERAQTLAAGARHQARRDSKRAAAD